MGTPDVMKIIRDIQAIVGSSNDVIQTAFEFLASPSTPTSMGANTQKLATLMAQYNQMIADDAVQTEQSF